MAKPIVKTVHAFDASAAHTIEFTWSGNQAYNNRMIIYDALTQAPIYDNTYSTNHYTLNHEIPANTLENDKKYAVQIQVFDVNGTASALSDKYYFYTISVPLFYFDGLVDGQMLYSPSISLDLIYSQSGTENLIWVMYHLYDAAKTLITETSADYSLTMSHSFKGLGNKTSYYVRATGVTVHGMALDTGYVKFTTSYQNPTAYARVYAEANEDTGFVNYYSNIVIISPDEDDYEYEDGFIDLTEIDPLSMILLQTVTSPNTSMEIDWTGIEGGNVNTKVQDSNTGIILMDYRRVNKIMINGNSVQASTPSFLGDYKEISSITDCGLMVNTTLVENVTQGLRLSKLPLLGRDSLMIKADGTRRYTQEVGYYKFSRSDNAIIAETVGNDYITYYDLGGAARNSANNICCTCIPVNKPSGSTISLDYDTGYIKIVWHNGSGINTEDKVKEFFKSNDVVVIYPLSHPKQIVMDPIAPMPNMENIKILRYSQALRIPGEKATFYLRMKSCRKTANFMKVYTGDKINFILSGRVDEENNFRLKLTVYGPGPKYIIYSDPIIMDSDDILTVIIRRDSEEVSEGVYKYNALYGLYVNVFDSSDADYLNVWLGENVPAETPLIPLNNKDLWIDLDGELTYIAEADVVRFYQDEEPAEAENNNIWIGGEL